MSNIYVTKTFLPPIEEYEVYIKKIWEKNQLTNQGPLLIELEKKTRSYLGVKKLQVVSSGTMALQLSLEALGIRDGEIITTPFSYVATTSSILWQRCTPVFVDIEPDTLCIDPDKIEAAITKKTKAIMPVHVFGNPCDVEKIDTIARSHQLKVIYDGAHAFGVKYKKRSLFEYGDVSICSFHATKLFHTVEGGAVISNDETFNKKLNLIKRFGHNRDDHFEIGINGKLSEFHAAMGLANLGYVDKIIKSRRIISQQYDERLKGSNLVSIPKTRSETIQNHGYYPIIFRSEAELLRTTAKLKIKNVFPRRYFYPSLSTLPYLRNSQNCPIAEDVAKRVLCLPIYPGLEESVINEICEVIV